MDYSNLASLEEINKTIKSLKNNGITAYFTENKADAKAKVLELIPEKAEIMDMTSVTLTQIGLDTEIQNSGRYNSIRKQFASMDRSTQGLEMQKLGAAPAWTIGSVHAITQNGEILIASNTGSQLPAYAYGASHVIWVVGAQKIVENLDHGFKRIYEYVLPLESERAHQAYGVEKSNVSKILIINKEVTSNRITIVIVNEKLGF